jgi:hypothetical protein
MKLPAILCLVGAGLALLAISLTPLGQATAQRSDRAVGNAKLLRGKRPSVARRPNTIVVRDTKGRIRGVGRVRPGPAGPVGPAGPPGISGYEVRERLRIPAVNFQIQTLQCGPGKQAIGGGAEALGEYAILVRSGPRFDPASKTWNGWVAVGRNEHDNPLPSPGSLSLNLWVICANPIL